MGRAEARAMLLVAWRDLEAARFPAAPEAPEASWGFHIQQAIEKALKAWILSLNGRVEFTHNIAGLLQTLRESGVDVEGYLTLSRFTVFAVQLRYDDEPDPLGLDRQEWQESIRALLSVVESFHQPVLQEAIRQAA